MQVVQIVLDSFIENTLKKRSSGFQSAQDFLAKQILEQERRLADAENKLAEFKRQEPRATCRRRKAVTSQSLQAEMSALQDLNAQQRMLSSRRQQLSAQLAAEKQYVPSSSVPAPAAGSRPAGANEPDQLILEQQARLEQLLRVYTPKHPEVIALEENLALLRAARRAELAKMGVTDIPERGSLVANPVYEQIRLQRNQVDVELAAVRGQIADRAARVRDMKSRMETMPEVEAELAQLTRDYDVLKERYTAMLQQLEAAKLSDAVGETDTVDFSIVDPPAALADAGGAAAPVVAHRRAGARPRCRRGGRVRDVQAESRIRFPDCPGGCDRVAGARRRQRDLARSAQGTQAGRNGACGRRWGCAAGLVRRRGAGPGRRQPRAQRPGGLVHELHRTRIGANEAGGGCAAPTAPVAQPVEPRVERRADKIKAPAPATTIQPLQCRNERTVRIDLVAMREAGAIAPEAEERRIAEEYRIIKRPLLKAMTGDDAPKLGNVVVITSAVPSEGKTFTSINLALSLAREHNREVVLVDGDVAKRHITHLFGLDEEPGLLDAGGTDGPDFEDVILRTDIPSLYLLPAGNQHVEATEILRSERTASLLAALASEPRRIVLIDSPPLLVTSEAGVLTSLAGHVVMVVKASETPQQVVEQAIATIAEDKPVSLVLNQVVSMPDRHYGYYGYYGDYGRDKAAVDPPAPADPS